MKNESTLRGLIREIISESANLNPKLLGSVGGKQAIVLGEKAKQFLISKGMTEAEFNTVAARLNNISTSDFVRYDNVFKKHAGTHGLKPSLLKAMSIEETTLGKSMLNAAGGTAAGMIQITKPTLDTLNANLPNNVRYNYQSLLTDPSLSIKIAAHYIQHFLIGKLGLKDRPSILMKYKTGPDASRYAARVEAFKKFVDIVGM